MTEYNQYRRTQIAEMAAWEETFDMSDVSISTVDVDNGSPKTGDMIARNPSNHADKWLVAAAYFAVNFEPLNETKSSQHRQVYRDHDNRWRYSDTDDFLGVGEIAAYERAGVIK